MSDASSLTLPQKGLRKLGLVRDIDLALHLPLRFEDETRLYRLRDVRDGDTVQIEATVVESELRQHPRQQMIVTVDDGSGTCELRFFSIYPSQQKALAVGKQLRIRGEIKGGFWARQMLHPTFRPAGGELPTALTPIYPTVAGLPQAYLRRAVTSALARVDVSETLPDSVLADLDKFHIPALWKLRDALFFLHHPSPDVALQTLEDQTHPAWQRLKAEELLAQQLSQLYARRERERLRAPRLSARVLPHGTAPTEASLHEDLQRNLPFALTAAQQRVCAEIAQDMDQEQPMHRLLQGDVGSGKTVVAALSAAICMDADWQCALMAPTEILAEQHLRKMVQWLEPLLQQRGQCVAWLSGGQKKKERTQMLEHIASGQAALVVGTHALIQKHVRFKNLALVIIDEQHRFGVAQRLALRNKLVDAQGLEPHFLMMSATPIPRTLAMSYYADLDVSTIDELPPGRTPVITKVLSENRRQEVIERIAQQVSQGRQVYWVCPLIEESEALDLRNATATHEELSDALPGVGVGLLHSRMSSAEKKAVMHAFTHAELSVLVSTTVIEVGVDVPNASLMVIEHAERFGLSQLHQLRGRVGRGAAASACVLLYSAGESGHVSETARLRLRAMQQTSDGFEIARRDLDIRGPGEFLGERQSGDALLRFADLDTDQALLEWAGHAAVRMLDEFPQHAQRHVTRWLGLKSKYLKA